MVMAAKYYALLLFALWAAEATFAQSPNYDPLDSHEAKSVESHELDIEDSRRQRVIPVRVYVGPSKGPMPIILYSHGLGGSRNTSRFLGQHWASRGYLCVFMQHPGSDESIWKNEARSDRMEKMRDNASYQNLVLRTEDVVSVLNQLEKWNDESRHLLYQRLQLERIGMSGHSFGAHTTQAVSGQTFPLIGQKFTDTRIDAAIAFSPSSPARGGTRDTFSKVKIPWLLMTGTKDTAPIGNQTVESRLQVYPNLPDGIDRYQIVLDEAPHSVFTDRDLRLDPAKENPNHHRVILGLSTAYWDTYLKQDSAAKAWLQGTGAKDLLESRDQWQWKAKAQP